MQQYIRLPMDNISRKSLAIFSPLYLKTGHCY